MVIPDTVFPYNKVLCNTVPMYTVQCGYFGLIRSWGGHFSSLILITYQLSVGKRNTSCIYHFIIDYAVAIISEMHNISYVRSACLARLKSDFSVTRYSKVLLNESS